MTSARTQFVSGFEIQTLSNASVSVALAPALGGRIVSLRDLASGREWLDGWRPASRRRLWAPANPRDFSTGPGSGIDECLPTVLPSRHDRRPVNDHGEVWSLPAHLDPAQLALGRLACRWSLRSLPLDFSRVVSLRGGTVRFAYALTNRAGTTTPFLWAWHALFSLRRGDSLHFAPSVKTCLTPGGSSHLPWPVCSPGSDLSRAEVGGQEAPCAKVFIGPLRTGTATLRQSGGSGLQLRWPAKIHPFAGIWITRGFWKGLHHWAVEPTNAPVDFLADAVARYPAHSWLAPGETREWTVTARVLANT